MWSFGRTESNARACRVGKSTSHYEGRLIVFVNDVTSFDFN